jgi:type IX secretion system PorP/SprF family membrane protein
MIKKILNFVCLYLVVHLAFSQQKAQFSQYMNNFYIINPAAGGTDDYTDLRASYRSQWLGMNGAPVTYYISGHGPIGKVKKSNKKFIKAYHTTGGFISNDVTGPTSRLNMAASYSYNLQVQKNFRMSAGAFLGVLRYTLDGSQLDFHDAGDNSTMQRATVPDLTVGVMGYSQTVYLGLSMSQLFYNKLDFDYTSKGSFRKDFSKLNYHYFLTAGVNIPITSQMDIIPSTLLKIVSPSQMALDLNAKIKYLEIFWVGLSYRNLDAIVAMAGVTFNKIYSVGYSYDGVISGLGKYNSGSHEILIGLKLKGQRKHLSERNFW